MTLRRSGRARLRTARTFSGLLVTVLLLALSPRARAEGPAKRVIALVVTNNRSAELGRPELRYADDDGAKYYDLFRMVSGEGDVELLTDLDLDSTRLFPEARAVAREPTKAGVASAVRRLGARAQGAMAAGERVEFYFVFAGHGDVDRGRGFLELRDGRLTSDDIEAMLHAIPATHAHVILDSCNSFFVLNPRKPGGRQIAVTEEAARSLSDRLPNVGVLLSTSAEAEVFEWSELQSGIFSHEVRSGLLGGADANGDGRVSYDEIRAFVALASTRIDNPLYRPKVFARGPNGRGDETLLDLTGAQARVIDVDGPERRLTVRDAEELPWIDVHKEAGAKMTLRLPLTRAAGASIDERDARAPGAPVIGRVAIDADPKAPDSALAPVASRGPNELLAKLFAAPYGPRAFAQWWQGAPKEEEPVYGVSDEDVARMRMLLENVADIEKQQRQGLAAASLGVGAIAAVGGAAALLDTRIDFGARSDRQVIGYSALGVGVVGLVYGGVELGVRTDGERLYASYLDGIRDASVSQERVVAQTERCLFDLADGYRRKRNVARGLGWALVGLAGAAATFLEIGAENATERWVFGLETSLLAVEGGLIVFDVSSPTPIERLADLWANDPGSVSSPRHVDVHVSLAPLAGGGFAGVAGSF